MPEVGPLICGSGSQGDTFGSGTWSNPGNITVSDNTYAICLLDPQLPHTDGGPHQSRYLYAQNFAFGETPLEPAHIITGFLLEVEAKVNSNSLTQKWVSAQIIGASGSRIGTAENPAINLTTTDTWIAHGGPTSLLGTTGLTGADIIDQSLFGFAMAFDTTGSLFPELVEIHVDAARMTIYYTSATGAKSKVMASGRIARRIGGALAT